MTDYTNNLWELLIYRISTITIDLNIALNIIATLANSVLIFTVKG